MIETLMIIGAMKAGTTTAFHLLSQHPEIIPAKVKEPEFFSPYQGAVIANYDDLWKSDHRGHKYRMEASTGYSKALSKEVPRNIKAYGITPKIIYILRDPFDRIESHFNFMKRSFGQSWRSKITDNHLIVASDYITHIDAFLGEFPHNNLMLVDFKLLSENPQIFLQKACEFLEIEISVEIPMGDKKNATQYEITFTEAWVRRNLSSIRKWAPQPAISTAKSIMSHFPRTGRKVTLTENQRKMIRDRLQPGMARLEKEHGFDVSQWGF